MSDGEKEERALDRNVLALAQEIAKTINAAPNEGREVLREMAINAVRDGVRIVEPPSASASHSGSSFNPFGIGIPLVFAGAILIFLFPPVGLVMFGAAAVMVFWGIVASLVARD